MLEHQRFLNQDLVLKVSKSVNPAVFDINKYEGFLDALCGEREYQKTAIRNTLAYLLSGNYKNITDLAEENYHSNETLQTFYGTFEQFKKYIQFPDKLSCSLDLATGTGKSYVIYGVARIMLAEGAVDHVLVVCPSTTIEDGLMEKFKMLSGDDILRALLPDDAVVKNPHIINATESITTGTICVENCHALYEHVKSSIRESLAGKGDRTLVINDETHHVFNQTGKSFKKWKDFLIDEDFCFNYVVGLSGTCYIGDDYFTDVISRYSLREAIEQGFVKTIDYVAEDSSNTQDEKLQKIYDNHIENKNTKYRLVRPLTILITKDIRACNKLTDDLIRFLAETEGISEEDAAKKVLEVTSSPKHKENVRKLKDVDRKDSPVEWITSVSMLTEGWDVKNVFQIVPHEERAFDSKLLIAQVLGRGLRIPEVYLGQKPVVTVFNHDRWSGRIKHLVDEVLEIEKRVYSYPVEKDPDYHFTLHNIDYEKFAETEEYKQEKEYEFTKGFITLIRQSPALERETEYVRATTGESRRKKTLVKYKMFSIEEIAEQLHNRFKSIDMETAETGNPTNYAEKYNLDWLKNLIRNSLVRIGESGNQISDENRQKIYQAFGVIHRAAAKAVRYRMSPKALIEVNTKERNRNSVGYAAIKRGDATIFFDELTYNLSDEESLTFIKDLEEDESRPVSAMEKIENKYIFKTPLNLVISDHKPERLFIRRLIAQENSKVIDSWLKSTDQDFYPIEYSWKKGEHPKRGGFNPDFFIKIGDNILVTEIKGDEEIREPSDENKAKYKAAKNHFKTLNEQQKKLKYYFNFLTPEDYDYYFDHLRNGNFNFNSKLDAELEKNGS
ncbi:MAG: DEAD/DEAH box helicase family protein [Deltaproteobacteria bacterium]|nr:DEAD/DEAH box helicase family protein [Deltaproteobacteria bacterium]